MENQINHITNFEDIDLGNLQKGDSITCKMSGAQGVDGSKYYIHLPDENGNTKITRIN